MTRASAACRRLMTIPGVGQLTALAFVAAIDDASRIRRSRDNDGAGAGTEYEVKSLMQRPFNESLDLAKDTNSVEALCAPSVQPQYSTDIVLLRLQVFGAGFDSDSAINSFECFTHASSNITKTYVGKDRAFHSARFRTGGCCPPVGPRSSPPCEKAAANTPCVGAART
jgi:Transposase IS116/IS110/IS902 family